MFVRVQDGRIKVGDRVVAVADELVAGLSADKVENTCGGPCGRAAAHSKVRLIQ